MLQRTGGFRSGSVRDVNACPRRRQLSPKAGIVALDAGMARASDQSGRHACGLLANVVVKAANLTKAEKEEIF
jgi:hypothetical protein